VFTYNAIRMIRRIYWLVIFALLLATGQTSAQTSDSMTTELAPCSDLFDTREPGFYFADASGIDGRATFILVSNNSDRTIPLRVHVLREDATCYWADTYSEIGSKPLTIPIHGDPTAMGQPVSVKVFPFNSYDQKHLAASMSTYSGPGHTAMSGVNGVELLTNRVYFAEGNVGGPFEETITVFNVTDQPTALRFEITDQQGTSYYRYENIPTGPGRRTFNVRDLMGGMSFPHSINVLAYYDCSSFCNDTIGGPVIVAQRTMTWNNGKESHSETGQIPRTSWWGAEGTKGGMFYTYFLVSNPSDSEIQVQFVFNYEGGGSHFLLKRVPAKARLTIDVNQELSLPDGNFSYAAYSPWSETFVIERAMYWGLKGGVWEGGHVAAGSPDNASKWHFAEGNTSGPYHSFLLIDSPSEPLQTVNLKFRTESGRVIERSTTVSRGRNTLNLRDFVPEERFSVEVSCYVRILAEMSMYKLTPTGMSGNAMPGRIVEDYCFYCYW
jgi:hypothetical protein